MEEERFTLYKSQLKPGYWICTDNVYKIVCVFKEKQFNEDCEVGPIDETINSIDAQKVGEISKEMGWWLVANYSRLLF